MEKKIKLSELTDPEKIKEHPELIAYFQQGGTWRELLGYDENTMGVQYKVGHDFFQEADYPKAAAVFSYLTLLDPYQYSYWIGHGMSKQRLGLFEQALASYTVASAIQPDHPAPRLYLAQCYLALHNEELAKEELDQCLKLASPPQHASFRNEAAKLRKAL